LTKRYSPAQINDTSGGKNKSETDCILARMIKIHKVERRKAAKLLDTHTGEDVDLRWSSYYGTRNNNLFKC
jgi:hypothetical protein